MKNAGVQKLLVQLFEGVEHLVQTIESGRIKTRKMVGFGESLSEIFGRKKVRFRAVWVRQLYFCIESASNVLNGNVFSSVRSPVFRQYGMRSVNASLDLSRFGAAPGARLSHLAFEGDRAFPAQC